jgi:hypothetical protein
MVQEVQEDESKVKITKVHRPRRLYEDPERIVEYINVGDIANYMKTAGPPGEFKPGKCYYNRDGDQLEIYWKTDACYAETCGDIVLMKAFDTQEVVGVKIPWARGQVALKEITNTEK